MRDDVTGSTREIERYVVNFDNPDCGAGHAIGYLNGQVKVALRNRLQVAYSPTQLRKSTRYSPAFMAKRLFKNTLLGNDVESHDLGMDLGELFRPDLRTASRDAIYSFRRRGRYRFLTLPKTETPADLRQHVDDFVYCKIDRFVRDHPEPFTVFVLPQNWQPDCEFEATRQWFRDAYVSARKLRPIPCRYGSGHLIVAVHVRRGDILPGRSFENLSDRLLPDDWYLARLSEVCDALPGPKHIHVFSEGSRGRYVDERGEPSTAFESFAARLGLSVSLHIDEPFLDDFHHLVSADVLIGSRSGMSHLAAVLSAGLKIMPLMWHTYRGVDDVAELDPGRPADIPQQVIAAVNRFIGRRSLARLPGSSRRQSKPQDVGRSCGASS